MGSRMGYEGKFYQGAAGGEAATLVTNVRDVEYDFDNTEGETTVRGDGSAPPIETGRVATRKVTITFQMVNKSADTNLTALLTAAYAGTPIALRLKDEAAGKGYNGDVNLKVKNGQPYKGEQTFDFTATPNDELRAPQLYI